jgi:cyclopropane fatty-acyl-phospholipid synthase-like methyltransferase
MDATRRDDVAERYDDLLGFYKLSWTQQDHQSIHFGYFDEEHDDSAAAVTNMTRQLADRAGIDADDRVLDVGCGAGGASVWLAQQRGVTVSGIDISDGHLELARSHASEHGVAELTTFAHDDYHDIEHVDAAAFDVVWALESLAHSDRKAAALEGLRSRLTEDGRIVIGDLFRTDQTTAGESEERFAAIRDDFGLVVEPIDAVVELLEDAGFVEIEVENVTDAVAPSAQESARSSRYILPLVKLGRRVGLASDAHVGFFQSWLHIHELMETGALGYYFVTARRGQTA